MKKRELREQYVSSTVITAENVKYLGEITAIKAMKVTMMYSSAELKSLYRGLVHDVFDCKLVDELYSCGYDIAQEAICFLCEHMGKVLDDTYKLDGKGRVVTIKKACFRAACNYIAHERTHIYNRCYEGFYKDRE